MNKWPAVVRKYLRTYLGQRGESPRMGKEIQWTQKGPWWRHQGLCWAGSRNVWEALTLSHSKGPLPTSSRAFGCPLIRKDTLLVPRPWIPRVQWTWWPMRLWNPFESVRPCHPLHTHTLGGVSHHLCPCHFPVKLPSKMQFSVPNKQRTAFASGFNISCFPDTVTSEEDSMSESVWWQRGSPYNPRSEQIENNFRLLLRELPRSTPHLDNGWVCDLEMYNVQSPLPLFERTNSCWVTEVIAASFLYLKKPSQIFPFLMCREKREIF
jgi:hypothetical protein